MRGYTLRSTSTQHAKFEIDLQISHHTGARSKTLPAHTIELIKFTRANSDAQIMKKQAPEFQDGKCHVRGMRDKIKLKKEITVKNG